MKQKLQAFQFLNQIIYRYIADYGEKFVSKLKQFVSNMNCGKNWWPNGNKKQRCENNDFLSILHLTSFMKYTKSKIEIGVRMRNLKKKVISFQTDTSHSLPMKNKTGNIIIKALKTGKIVGKFYKR